MKLDKLYEPREGGLDMGRVRESEETDDGAGRGAARGAECAARQKHTLYNALHSPSGLRDSLY